MVDFPKSLSPKRVLKLLKAEKNPHAAFALLDSVTRHPKYNHSPDKAMAVFQQMEEIFGCAPGVRSYNSLLNAFIESNQQDRAEKFFAYFETVGLEPNWQTYNVLIKISCKKKHFEKAKGLLNWMWEKGLEPDVFGYGALINGLAKGDSVSANEIWERLVKDSEVYPNVVTYNVVVNGKTKELWEVMVKCGCCNVVSYNTLIRGLFENEKVDEVISVWGLMCEKACVADATTYGVLVHGLCKNGYLNKALQILKEAENARADLDAFAYSSMINGLCREGILDEAARLVGKMDKCGYELSSHVCNALICGYIRASKLEDAILFFRERAPRQEDWHGPQHVASSSLNMWHQALDKGFEPDVTMHNIVIHGLCSAGNAEDALQLYFQMGRWNCIPYLVTYNTLMEGFYKIRDCEKASEV
ncbi:hypothetical protein ACFX10_032737 [Malus domestica]